LMCTTFLHLHHDLDEALPEAVLQTLRGIEKAVKRLLELSLACGEVWIITNALTDWVEYSAEKYMPDLLPVLRRVHIVSARTRFESEHPGKTDEWKTYAFLEVKQLLDPTKLANLLSLGDSLRELEAVKALGRSLGWEPGRPEGAAGARPRALVKTVKFKEAPSAEDLQVGLERKWSGSSEEKAPAVATVAA